MGFNFPASPTSGQLFPATGTPLYRWNGQIWESLILGGAALITVSDNPPVGVADNTLWYESDTGAIYLKYNDGDSSQWVSIVGGVSDSSKYALRYDLTQTLTTGQQAQACSNANAVNKAGDTMTGALNVPAGAANTQAPQVQEVVKKSGDTMTGNLTIAAVSPALGLNKTIASNNCSIAAYNNGNTRWTIVAGDGTTETGSNVGSNFAIGRFNDAGAYLDAPLSISRSTGLLTLSGDPTAALGATTKQYADTQDNLRVLKTGDTVNGTLNTVTLSTTNFSQSGGSSTFYQNAGTIAQGGGGSVMVQCPGSGNQPFITFHIPGVFACNMGMDNTGYFYMGGWSFGGTAYRFWSSRDGAWPSDYRIKKNIAPLASTWERIKALRPVTYTHKPLPPLTDSSVVDDGIERWGFIAHELQETLTESAAVWRKDEEKHIQNPNPMTVIAALTKALQEAMARIEALEANLKSLKNGI